MGRAIAVVALIVLLAFAFVGWQLYRKGASAVPPPRRAPLLTVRDDGSVEAVMLRLTRFEQRLIEEEQRSQKLTSELSNLRTERDDLETQVQGLEDEVKKLRKQLADSAARPPAPAPAPAPGAGGNAPAPTIGTEPKPAGQ